MAKRERSATQSGPASLSIPDGYSKRTDEVKGFWEPKTGPVHFIPKSARVFDNKTEPLKFSILIQGESVGVNSVITKDGEAIDVNQGESIGVWYKPGMRVIGSLRNVPVYMFENGSRSTGKPNEMKLFEVMSPKQGEDLVIDGDYRKKSKGTVLPFTVKAGAETAADEPF